MEKIKKLIFTNKRWILFAIVLIVFVIIAENVWQKELFDFDSTIYEFMMNHRSGALTTFMKIVTQLGGAIVLICACILSVTFIKDKKCKITIPVNLVVITIINILLKEFFERPRPNDSRLIQETGFSFPSGHSMVSMAFYGYLVYLIYKNVKNKKIRFTLCIFLFLLILSIGTSRIYLGVHYTSDVIAGLCFSTAYLIICISSGLYQFQNKN